MHCGIDKLYSSALLQNVLRVQNVFIHVYNIFSCLKILCVWRGSWSPWARRQWINDWLIGSIVAWCIGYCSFWYVMLGLQYVAAYSSSLQDISVSDCQLITDYGVSELAAYRTSCLRYISLAHCPAVSDQALYALSRHCTRLRYLNVRACVQISDHGVTALASRTPGLRFCDLGECVGVGDASLRALAGGCGRLRRLSVRGCTRVTNAGVCVVAKQCNRLRQLCVLDCPAVGAVALQTVRRSCRQCTIEHNNMAFYWPTFRLINLYYKSKS